MQDVIVECTQQKVEFSLELKSLSIHGGPKSRPLRHIWRLTSSAYIFKMLEPISINFGALHQRFILNTSIYSLFLKFITQWRHLAKV